MMPENFFESTILQLFEDSDLTLTEQQKRTYIPQFQTQLERSITNGFMPRLSESQLAQFVQLMDAENTTGEQWSSFWHEAIPNFDEELKSIVSEFRREMIPLLA